jgi:cytochrome oxidase assembly protein ShyY1
VRGDISNPNYEPATLRTYLFWGFSAVGVFVCLSAGVWQMRRHDWKAELIERRGKQLEADPQDLTAALATTGGER